MIPRWKDADDVHKLMAVITSDGQKSGGLLSLCTGMCERACSTRRRMQRPCEGMWTALRIPKPCAMLFPAWALWPS